MHNRGVSEAAENPPPVAADRRLHEALTGAGTSLWEWYCQTDVLSDLDEGSAMLGYAPDEIAPTQRAWDELIHPQDRADNDAAYERHARGEAARLRGCLGRIERLEDIRAGLARGGFEIELFEDHSEALASLWARLVFERGAAAFYAEVGADRAALKAVKCGYYLVVAGRVGR